jgi:hypothetical protein
MLQAATWQHRLPNARIVFVALVMAVSGCASTGPNAPKTNQETAAGAVVGALGAAGGAVGGTVGGAVFGLMCGPLFVICSPVMAVVGGVKGAVKGGEAGARAGVNSSRSASAPESQKSASEPSTPESSGQSMVIEPVLAPGSDKRAPGDSEKTVDLPASAPQISSPVTHEKLEVQTALADPTRTAARAGFGVDSSTHLLQAGEFKTRVLTGEELVKHLESLGKVEVKAPTDLMSLTFQPGNRIDIVYWGRTNPSGHRQEGSYVVRPNQDQVCFRVSQAGVPSHPWGPVSQWMSDCFRVSQTDEKTYSLKTIKGDYSFSYAVR